MMVVRGGSVWDASTMSFASGDVWVDGERIVPAPDDPDSPAVTVVRADGCIVTPGLVDLHTHVLSGQVFGLDMDETGPPSGVTTFIDAGSAGANTFGVLEANLRAHAARSRVFLNISAIGLAGGRLVGESTLLEYCDVEAAEETIRTNRRRIIGVKVRSAAAVVGPNGGLPFERAMLVARNTGLPLMVHIGDSPPDVGWMLDQLDAGDIITHCFTPHDQSPFTGDADVRRKADEASDRGVLFDVGHGQHGFSPQVAAAAVGSGFIPDTISSDLHEFSRSRVIGLPTVMGRMVDAGMDLDDVVYRSTTVPAQVVGLPALGTLDAGTPADVAVFRVTRTDEPRGPDGDRCRIETVATVMGGRVVFTAER